MILFCRSCGAKQEDFHVPCSVAGRWGQHEVYVDYDAVESQNRAHREPKGERPGGGRGKGE